MAIDTKVGTFTKNTTTGNQAITGIGFLPKVVLFYGVKNTATGFGIDFTQLMGWGISSTQRYVVGVSGDDNDASGKSNGVLYGTGSIVYGDGAAGTWTLTDLADLVSLDSDGFTINWTTVSAQAIIVGYVALGGADLTNVFSGDFNHSGATGNESVTGVGFQPDITFLATEAKTTSLPGTAGKGWNFGVGISSTERFAISGMGARAGRSGEGGGYLSNVNCLFGIKKATQLEYSWDFVSQDTDGFTINNTQTKGTTVAVAYLCLKTTNAQVNINELVQPTSTGNQATTGIGFKPSVIMGFSGGFTAGTTGSVSRNNLSIWATDGTNEGSQVAATLDNLPSNTINKTYLSTTKIGICITPATTPTLDTDANIISFDTDGYTINWTTVDATQRIHMVIAFGEAGAGVTSNSFTKTSDARVLAVKSFIKTSDSDILKVSSFTKTSDSLIVSTVSFNKNSDSRILAVLSFNKNSDSVVFKVGSFNLNSDALIVVVQSFTKNSDAIVFKVGSFNLNSDALIVVVQSFTKTSDSRIFDVLSFTKTSDALISGGTSFTKTSDAIVFKVGSFTKNSDALIILIVSFTKTSDSIIFKVSSFNKTSDTRILAVLSFDLTSDSRIFDVLSFTKTSDALIVSTVSFTKTSDAQVSGSPKINLFSDAIIFKVGGFTKTSDSLVVVVNSFTKTSDSRILVVQSFTKQSNSRILVVQSFTKSADTIVAKTSSFNLLSDSIIVVIQSFTKTSDSIILSILSITKVSDAIIFKVGLQFTLTSDAIITSTGTFSFTLTSDANVELPSNVKRRTGSIKSKNTNVTGSIKNRNTYFTGKVNKYG